jgi:hypothetical protein
MTTIRIAIAFALVLAAAFAGGAAHAKHAEVPLAAHSIALGSGPTRNSPVLCCYP